jgi:hypothetical protein
MYITADNAMLPLKKVPDLQGNLHLKCLHSEVTVFYLCHTIIKI